MSLTLPASRRSVCVFLHIVLLRRRASRLKCPLEGYRFVVDTIRKARPPRGKYCVVRLFVRPHSSAPDSLSFPWETAKADSSTSGLDSASDLNDDSQSAVAILFSKLASKSSISPSIAISFSGSLSLCAFLFRFNHRFDIGSTAKRSFSSSSVMMIRLGVPQRRARGATTRIPKSSSSLPSLLSSKYESIRRGRKPSVTTVTGSPLSPVDFPPRENRTESGPPMLARTWRRSTASQRVRPDPAAPAPNPESFGWSSREQCKSCRYWLYRRPPVAARAAVRSTEW